MAKEVFYKLILNGKTIPDFMIKYVSEVEVEETDQKSSLARITVQDFDQVWLNDKGIVKGNELIVELGYRTSYRRVFKGKISSIDGDYPPEGTPILVISALSSGTDKMTEERDRTFTKKKISDIFVQMIREAGLTPDVDDSRKILDSVVQREESNIEFIDRWCKQLGWYHYKNNERGTYYCGKKPYPKGNIKTISYKQGGKEIRGFRPAFSQREEE